jgi:hypothetical protein
MAIDQIISASIANGAVVPADLSTGGPSWDASGNFQFNSGYGSVATAYGCRAWVNFDGSTGSGNTIRASGNVSSVTRSSTGVFSIAFANAMPDANYVFTGNGIFGAGPSASLNETFQPYAFATGSIGFQCTDPTNNAFTNPLYACVAIFR